MFINDIGMFINYREYSVVIGVYLKCLKHLKCSFSTEKSFEISLLNTGHVQLVARACGDVDINYDTDEYLFHSFGLPQGLEINGNQCFSILTYIGMKQIVNNKCCNHV